MMRVFFSKSINTVSTVLIMATRTKNNPFFKKILKLNIAHWPHLPFICCYTALESRFEHADSDRFCCTLKIVPLMHKQKSDGLD